MRDLLSTTSLIYKRVELQTLQRLNFIGKSAHTHTQSDFKRSWHQGRREEEKIVLTNASICFLLTWLKKEIRQGLCWCSPKLTGDLSCCCNMNMCSFKIVQALCELWKRGWISKTLLLVGVKLEFCPVQFPEMHLITESSLVSVQGLQFLMGLFSYR